MHRKSARSKRFSALAAALCAAALHCGALLPVTAHAQAIVINDCNGFTRAVKQTDPGKVNKVEVQVSTSTNAPATGVNAQLTNVVTGEVVTATAQNGIVTFEGIAPGIYSFEVTQQGIVVGTMWVTGTAASAALATGVGVGSGILASGVAAGAVIGVDSALESGGNDNGDDDGGNNPQPAPSPEPQPTPAGPRPTATPTPCPVCNPDAEPTPIDDFFNSAKVTPQPQQAQLLSPYR